MEPRHFRAAHAIRFDPLIRDDLRRCLGVRGTGTVRGCTTDEHGRGWLFVCWDVTPAEHICLDMTDGDGAAVTLRGTFEPVPLVWPLT